MSKWAWTFGEFESYHNLMLHLRREERGNYRPAMWRVSQPDCIAKFRLNITLTEAADFSVVTRAQGVFDDWSNAQNSRFLLHEQMHFEAGEHSFGLTLQDKDRFPAFFIDHPAVGTPGNWEAQMPDGTWEPVACTPAYEKPTDDPAVFPFRCKKIPIVSSEAVNGGVLYDFGRESFGPVRLKGAKNADTLSVVYGESREEALDAENAVISETLTGNFARVRPSRAFRYIYIKSALGERVVPEAKLEYLPLRDIASFSCDDPTVERIWQVCADTFHLNSREAYLDGIKRDRWVWSGDAYQSYMVNRYLYADPEIIKRTVLFLLGKPPYYEHINTINDYTLYLLISLAEYLFDTGDAAFIRRIWKQVCTLYDFMSSRLDENGWMVQRENDWIFIDWSPMDKSGPLCAEQILLWKTYLAMAELAKCCDAPDVYTEKAAKLKENIDRCYWDEEKQAYIDCFTSGKRNVTRHANIFAIYYDFVSPEKAQLLNRTVLENDAITQISTPYFKLYELMAKAKLGNIRVVQDGMTNYWGKMLSLGATSVWEEYHPEMEGVAHYAMYGLPFDKSLCHAWGSGPILLLGKYCCGVQATAQAYQTFEVRPNFGDYHTVNAVVPLGQRGKVTLHYQNGVLQVLADADGGTLIFAGKTRSLPAGKRITVRENA